MLPHCFALILAGGVGTRLWPVSRKQRAKQHLALLGRQTLLVGTYRRMRRLLSPSRIFVATHRDDVPMIRAQLPQLSTNQIISEPVSRGTGAAIGYGLLHILKQDASALVMTINADAFLADERRWLAGLRTAYETARHAPTQLLIVGVRPRTPETGYGYIRAGRRVGVYQGFPLFTVKSFEEKPTRAVAARYLKSRSYYWNTTVLCGSAEHIFGLYKKYMPQTFHVLSAMRAHPNSALFHRLPISDINYDLLEKAHNMLLLAVDKTGWADIGHWQTVQELAPKQRVAQHGPLVSLGGSKNFIVSPRQKLVATVGVSKLLIIDTPDALLVCDRSRAQDVKRVVTVLKQRRLHQYV